MKCSVCNRAARDELKWGDWAFCADCGGQLGIDLERSSGNRLEITHTCANRNCDVWVIVQAHAPRDTAGTPDLFGVVKKVLAGSKWSLNLRGKRMTAMCPTHRG